MYGKNVMGAHADKLSYEERWQVIHYIRSLQAAEQGLVYSEEENTFTNDIPGSEIVIAQDSDDEGDHSEGHDGEEGHDDHGDDHGDH